MSFQDKTVVVTGGASGIGAALIARFNALGARTFVIDKAASSSERSACCDVTDPDALKSAIERIEENCGTIDIYVSNAGVLSKSVDLFGNPDDWTRCWKVNVMAHVHAARTLIPAMRSRGAGHFVVVASAAGLLNQIGDPAYSATKHAAVSFADSLAITCHGTGVGVSVVCPQYVATPLIDLSSEDARGGLLTAEEVADCVVSAVEKGQYMVMPHPEVHAYVQSRARDHDAWIAGMARLRQRAVTELGDLGPAQLYKLL